MAHSGLELELDVSHLDAVEIFSPRTVKIDGWNTSLVKFINKSDTCNFDNRFFYQNFLVIS